ncbi:response regulator transcription factor [Mongoliitalea lutea]|uniref:response regulator transcription factor n=1 Tax=Mongoliitalea lutea TaxID=849756 RepID=UPI00167C26F1|nr:helix-turn-helix transcriptional regulator [Mongoliitalea lutea]
MNFFHYKHSRQKHLHSIMLPSIVLTFIGSNYLCFAEVGPLLEWNTSFYWLYWLMVLGFSVSWIYAGAINKEYQKAQAVISETETKEAILQAKLKTLSRKEREVLNLNLQHKNNQQISDELFISPSTLKSHINHIYKKLEVSRRQEILEFFG